MTVSALAVATGLFAACGDDSGDDGNTAGTGGTGGRGGTGGTAGTAGTAGAPGNGGTAGTAGAPGNGGTAGTAGAPGNGGTAGTAGNNGGGDDDPDAGDGGVVEGDGGLSDAGSGVSPSDCTGCLELRTVVASDEDQGFFQVVFDASLDMSADGATVTFRVGGLSPEEEVTVMPFATDNSGFTFGAGDIIEVSPDGFVDLELELEAITDAGFDSADILAVGVVVSYNGDIEPLEDGGAATETVSVALDSVTFAGIDTDDLEFTDDEEGFGLNAFAGVQTTSIVHH